MTFLLPYHSRCPRRDPLVGGGRESNHTPPIKAPAGSSCNAGINGTGVIKLLPLFQGGFTMAQRSYHSHWQRGRNGGSSEPCPPPTSAAGRLGAGAGVACCSTLAPCNWMSKLLNLASSDTLSAPSLSL
jgi:hypothetical protein